MTPAEEGAYIRLLAIAWLSDDCGLPDNDGELSVLSRLGEGWFKGGVSVVKKKFISRDGRLYNLRLLEERKKQEEWRQKSSEGGKKSANTRWGKKKSNHKGGYQLVTECLQPNCNPSSPSSSPKRVSKDTLITKPVRVCLPEWFSQETWDTFLAHRRSVRAAITPTAYPSFIAKFSKLRDAGFEPSFVVETMLEKGWRWFKPEWVDRKPLEPSVERGRIIPTAEALEMMDRGLLK